MFILLKYNSMYLTLLIILFLIISQLFSTCANYTNRIFKSRNYGFKGLLVISIIAAILSNIVTFCTMYFLGKNINVLLLQCILIVSSVIAVSMANHIVMKEKVDMGTYITLFSIVLILIVHDYMKR
jgi:hypothetical protein